jgi:hypothetical protein
LAAAPDIFRQLRKSDPDSRRLAGQDAGERAKRSSPAAIFRRLPDPAIIPVNRAKEGQMGSLIPIGGGGDAEIKLRLNTAFNDSNIKIVRDVVANENLFDGKHHLHRLAYRLGTYPIGKYVGDDPTGKWFYFLKIIVASATHGGESTADSITKILSYAMRTPSVKRVVFDAMQSPGTDHYISPNNPVKDADIAPLVDMTGTLAITLVCPSSLPNNSSPLPNQKADIDESPQKNIEKPPIKIFTPANLSPPALSRKTRAPKKTGGKKTAGKKTKAARKKKKKAKKSR